jgi:hypothetical protein
VLTLYRNQRVDYKGDSENLKKSRKNEKPKTYEINNFSEDLEIENQT